MTTRSSPSAFRGRERVKPPAHVTDDKHAGHRARAARPITINMSDRRPKVSIGLPVYNGQRYLRESVDSLLAQTFEDFELILCDNASTDETASICRDYAARDPRVRYHRNATNIGAIPNFNAVFEQSRGEYFKWAASDDIHAPRFLEKTVAILDGDPSVILAYGKTILIDDAGNQLDSRPVNLADAIDSPSPSARFRAALHEEFCTPIFGLIRADILSRTGLHRNFYSSDKVLIAELSLHGRFHRVDDFLFHRRCHAEQSTTMSSRARAKWAIPSAAALVPFQLRAFCTYFAVALKSPISIWQKFRCCCSAVFLLAAPDKWRKLLLPGPYNYFGFDPFRRRRACAI
jgi:glycosyltransferase involved in cell wall biosynthesis